MARALGWLWLSPVAAIVWPLYVLPAWALGLIRFARWFECVPVFAVQLRWDWWARLWIGWGGHAMPGAIIVIEGAPRWLLRHERRHVTHWMWLGPLFPIVYLVGLVFWGYREHPLERDARAHE